ncbi:hypothetical protein N8I77_009756 [Diaporthe amygdali]|uniref:Uncharacterized protein n=1 Tax=Phomopsis amygdali TaxID=1214568 RepID=A0AAD9W0T4_PHOAM|nr:hypothetical protein N8I77_009756 [Diaporthe amygdali]
MTNEQSNTSQSDKANHIVDKVATRSVTSPNVAFENGSKESVDSALSLPQEMTDSASVSSAQSPPSRPLWNTREGRIAGYRRMIEKNYLSDHRANFEALIRYYEEGGKVPEGDEEVWAVEGEASFGIRDYLDDDQMPKGWLYKLRYCDVRDDSNWMQ